MASGDALRSLLAIVTPFDAGQFALLTDMATAIACPTVQVVSPKSDIVVPDFSANFSNRLKIHHASTEEKFKKKAFEFAFRAASRAAGRTAEIIGADTNPGADVIVNGVAFSLKTEAARSISLTRLTISKLMEARWIRECRTGADFLNGVQTHVVPHLARYERVLTLRAFDEPRAVRYDLVEIPIGLLRAVGNLRAHDFSERTPNGGTTATVIYLGRPGFQLRLDGSVEKITVSGLDIALCTRHASWTVPVAVASGDNDENGGD